jgi:hypothetical protein
LSQSPLECRKPISEVVSWFHFDNGSVPESWNLRRYRRPEVPSRVRSTVERLKVIGLANSMGLARYGDCGSYPR